MKDVAGAFDSRSGVRVEVVPDVDVRQAVAVDVERREADRELPALEAGRLHLLERPVAPVAEDEVRVARVPDDEVREAVVVEVGPHRRDAPAAGDDAGLLRDVLERAVAAVAEEARAVRERLRLPVFRQLRAALHLLDEDEVQPAVAVEVRERGAAAHRRDELAVLDVAVEPERDAGGLRHVREEARP